MNVDETMSAPQLKV